MKRNGSRNTTIWIARSSSCRVGGTGVSFISDPHSAVDCSLGFQCVCGIDDLDWHAASPGAAGLDIPINDLEAHFLAGGDVLRVVNAMISADKANIPMSFKRAAAIDLAGRNVLEAVQMSVLPKVIETPRITAVAKDGIQLIAVSRETVRANIDRLVGGAWEETVIARVGEGMVSTIGSSATHKAVLENPDDISKHILSKGLDAGTAFEILSIDIADVDVGQNIGAKLQIDQANADKQIAQAKAEERRAMAVAMEQEMRARRSRNAQGHG